MFEEYYEIAEEFGGGDYYDVKQTMPEDILLAELAVDELVDLANRQRVFGVFVVRETATGKVVYRREAVGV